jgi:hypothetical protein
MDLRAREQRQTFVGIEGDEVKRMRGGEEPLQPWWPPWVARSALAGHARFWKKSAWLFNPESLRISLGQECFSPRLSEAATTVTRLALPRFGREG